MECTLPIHFGSGVDDAFSALYWLEDQEMVANDKGHYTLTASTGEEYKWTKNTWRTFFDANREWFKEMIMAAIDSDANAEIKTEQTVAEDA